MLQSILSFKGVKALQKETQKQIKAGFGASNIYVDCPSEGESCVTGSTSSDQMLCMAGDIGALYCVRGRWRTQDYFPA